MKRGLVALGTAENESGRTKMKTRPGALGTAENESRSSKQENWTRRPRYRRKRGRARNMRKPDSTPSVPSKMSPRAQNMKIGPDNLGTVENESGRAKHENGYRRPRYRRKRVRARITLKQDPMAAVTPKMSPGTQNLKTGPDDLGTAENDSSSAKHENGARCPPYRRKRVRERKT
jgi:hypothetical protein